MLSIQCYKVIDGVIIMDKGERGCCSQSKTDFQSVSGGAIPTPSLHNLVGETMAKKIATVRKSLAKAYFECECGRLEIKPNKRGVIKLFRCMCCVCGQEMALFVDRSEVKFD